SAGPRGRSRWRTPGIWSAPSSSQPRPRGPSRGPGCPSTTAGPRFPTRPPTCWRASVCGSGEEGPETQALGHGGLLRPGGMGQQGAGSSALCWSFFGGVGPPLPEEDKEGGGKEGENGGHRHVEERPGGDRGLRQDARAYHLDPGQRGQLGGKRGFLGQGLGQEVEAGPLRGEEVQGQGPEAALRGGQLLLQMGQAGLANAQAMLPVEGGQRLLGLEEGGLRLLDLIQSALEAPAEL